MRDPAEAQAVMRQMIDGYRISQLICVAAELGIADILSQAPMSFEDLARATESNAHALHRLLRALSSAGVFERLPEGRFSLNTLAECLRTDSPVSLRAWALASSGQFYGPWGHLSHAIRTGETAFDELHGFNAWQCRDQDRVAGHAFNEAMGTVAAFIARAVLESCDFSPVRTLVDVGGGQGTLIAEILRSHPLLRGILFDLPAAANAAKPFLEKAGLAARCDVVAGSFFQSVPGGGDAYVLSRVIHDWQDEQAAQILRNVRSAMSERGLLILIERVMDAERPGAEAALSDVNMLVMNGGRERTEEEFHALLHACGFEPRRTIPTRSVVHVIEALAV